MHAAVPYTAFLLGVLQMLLLAQAEAPSEASRPVKGFYTYPEGKITTHKVWYDPPHCPYVMQRNWCIFI